MCFVHFRFVFSVFVKTNVNNIQITDLLQVFICPIIFMQDISCIDIICMWKRLDVTVQPRRYVVIYVSICMLFTYNIFEEICVSYQ